MLVMLDLDNTLVDRQSAVAAWVGEFRAEWDLPPEAEQWIMSLDRDGYADRASVFSAVRSRYDLGPPVDELLEAYRRRIIELATPAPGALACLEALRSCGLTLAIVSNGSSRQQNGKIDALGLRASVDAVVVSGDIDIKKPDPRIFEKAAELTGTTLAGSWMVGDSPEHDIVGADTLGIRTVWLRRARRWSVSTVRPTLSVHSLTELTELAPRLKAEP